MYFRLHDFEFRQFDTVIQNNNVIVAVVGRIRLPAPSLRLICRITALFIKERSKRAIESNDAVRQSKLVYLF